MWRKMEGGKRGIAFYAQLFLVCVLLKSTDAITSLSVTSQPYNVNENAGDGSTVIPLADILDVGAGGGLAYSIVGLTSNDPFQILDTTTGEVTLDLSTVTLDHEERDVFMLTLRADDPSDSTFATVDVTILIADVNEVPTFLSLPRTVRIRETTTTGTVIYNLLNAAFDQDEGQSLTYTINPASTEFAISGTSVETLVALDYDTAPISYELVIEVADDGSPTALTATSTLTISLVDVNDESPTFPAATCTGTANDDAAVGSAVTLTVCTLTATDADSGDIITYSLSGADSSYYAIDVSNPSGINVAQSLSGQAGTHTITVTAIDTAGNAGTLTVSVIVADTSDNVPICSPSVYFVSVVENTATGTSVVTLTCTDADAGDTLAYTISSGVDGTTPEFAMSATTIEMMETAVALDYDILDSINYQYAIKVDVSDGTNTVTATVIIQVTGINDNTPAIAISPAAGSVSEDAAIGTTVLAASAYTVSDADDGTDGALTYSLSVDNDGASKFDIVASTGVVVLIDSLDTETFATYTLTVTVTDGGTNPSALSVSASYNLIVANVNDIAPSFAQTLYEDTILENAAANSVVRTLAATEGGEGDTLTYSIVSGNTNNKFAIAGTNNDEIQLATIFALTTDPMTYLLGIKVTDSGTPTELTATTTVRVDVTLVNSDTPAFSVFDPTSFIEAENTAAGTVITTYTATDTDYGSYGTITYSTTVSPTSDLFVYDGATGQLTLARMPDYETDDPQYEMILTAADGGGLSTTSTLTVFITPQNDNTPYFDKGQYVAQIFESDTAGTVITTLSVADADLPGDNFTTTIFTGNSAGKFQLKTGTDTTTSPVVELATTIDLSTDPSSYTLVLQVTDSGAPALTGSATINVIVTDTNTAPTIADATFSINEDAGIGDTVGTVQATDPDSGTDGQLTYTTSVSPSAGDSLFVYDTSSGGIEVIGALDYETLTQYIMTIIVQDGAAASATASVTINIGDVNDVAPSFDQTLYQVSINEDEATGTNVVTFVMTDVEGTGSITFDFVKGNGAGKFILNSNSVQINSVINIDSPDLDDVHYTLVVKAMDGGVPELTSTATVEVEINPVNENPDFSALTTPFISQVQESDAIGTTIATLTAVDNDYGTQGELTYALAYVTPPTTQVLTLDPDTAVLKVATALDYETQDKVYTVRVTATDGGGGSAVFTATVSIIDVNDNTPVFSPATYTTSINENTAQVGDNVITVTATDADDAAFGTVGYVISAGNTDGVFTIGTTSGLITVQSTTLLDYETTTQYALTVLGTDGATGADQRTATVTVYVDVDPANEHDPVFTSPSSSPFAVTIAESAALGNQLYTVVATDQDNGSDGQIKFSITSGDLGKFNIDETTGVVYVADTLDKETLGTYSLAIRATDQSSTARTADITLAVTVSDVNDNSPVCSPDVYTSTLAEDTSAGTLVAWVLCSDADIDAANNALSYSITAGNAEGKFEVSTAGIVTVATGQTLDYETTTSYLLDVSVSDVSGTAVTAEVAVVVTGVNEFPPAFTATTYSATVVENQSTGTLVTSVAATDSDSGADGTISYNITSGNELNHFILDSSSGLISTAAVLDRETTASYTLVLTADDGGTTLDTATVLITVSDLNDNAADCPTFYSVLVSDDALTNSIIETVVCTDADISPNNVMSYSIVTGNTNSDFSIDSTGDVRVENTLDDAVTEFYTLEVWVTDGTQYTTITYVYVQVQDASTTGLTFIPSNTYSFSVAENSAVGTAVGTVYAGVAGGQIAFSASPVVSTGGAVTFAISTATEHNGAQATTLFQISNSSSGAITVLFPPDRETDDAVQFVVIASSAGPPALSAEATIFVDITDVNDNTPVFVSSFYSGECGTTSDFGQAIVTINATDADEGTSGTVTYGESAEYPTLFELDTSTGNIRLVVDQTLATLNAYLMTMTGTDGGSPALSSQTTVRIDAYDPYTTLVDIELAMTEDQFWTRKDTFLSEMTTILRTQYATARCGLAYITRKDVSVITTNRRRLLTTQGEVVARVYGVRNDNADTAAGINNNKEFFTDAEMLSTITGSGLTITDSITVQDYDDGTTTTTWIQYPASIALVVLSCIFFVLMVALIIALVLWCRRKRNKGKISKKDSVKEKPEKQQRWSSPLITAVPVNNATKQPTPKRKADVVYIDRTEFDGEAVDDRTGREYYYNTKTGQRKWKDGLGNSAAVVVAAGKFKAPRNNVNAPKTTKTNRDSDVETIALDGSTFDGQARDPDTGRGYLFNSRTGDRKWKD